jgi:hypothetical protein
VLLTHEDIRAVASDLGLGVVAKGLIGALVPAYRLEPSTDGAHRVGGEPDLVADQTWPRNRRTVDLARPAFAGRSADQTSASARQTG